VVLITSHIAHSRSSTYKKGQIKRLISRPTLFQFPGNCHFYHYLYKFYIKDFIPFIETLRLLHRTSEKFEIWTPRYLRPSSRLQRGKSHSSTMNPFFFCFRFKSLRKYVSSVTARCVSRISLIVACTL